MTRLSLAAIVASTACVASASADLVVGWTIPNAFPAGAGNVPTGTFYSVGAGDQGATSLQLGNAAGHGHNPR
jgi:hypothetical protein